MANALDKKPPKCKYGLPKATWEDYRHKWDIPDFKHYHGLLNKSKKCKRCLINVYYSGGIWVTG